jgi:hypothetical protein
MNQMQSYWQPNAKCSSNGATKIFDNSNNCNSCQVKLIISNLLGELNPDPNGPCPSARDCLPKKEIID